MNKEHFKSKAQCEAEQEAMRTNGQPKLSDAIFEGVWDLVNFVFQQV